ncbi:MAG: ferredoxin [Pseudomonadales bacterium]
MIEINLKKCIKSGQCCYMFPDLVRLREDGFPAPLPQIANGHQAVDLNRAEELVDTCPAMAIHIVESD